VGTFVRTFSFQKYRETEVNYIKQIKPKSNDLVNEFIPNTELLVIDDEGNKLGILPKRKALELAFQKELDLVVVSPDSKPMVAKFMDYSKHKFEQQKKLREIKKNQVIVDIKEIRLSPTIDKHDFDTKLKHALKFLEKGDKVKISIRLFGRMITHSEVGLNVINRFIEEIGTKATVESKPKLDGRHLIAMIAPNNN
jgi:translation initiation factor IF-3